MVKLNNIVFSWVNNEFYVVEFFYLKINLLRTSIIIKHPIRNPEYP
jgi:hypothetical protein